ncbi:B12-binding domain-containing radical SAM protein [Anaeromyxobacter oryzae]|uniref:Magnesium-protoporphyrin IX monomethyl ester cyclase n=1 Tax=Anaeromyxobacter oryzae TaxID=2918170 RepID=A0ABN6N2V3_9BACT|nr:cobalamin-dependent protein [Anaeromyxobacter oryzae]BDG06850.1 magnesium-protoporphyrin IX monomethyl ester cyclase [Anaeromyxobacter oryzae]
MSVRRPKVLLVTSPYHSGVVEAAGVWLPLSFVYVGGAARAAGAEVRIYDAMSLFASHQDIANVIAEFQPDIVGTTAITATEPDARVICATAKRWNPAVKTVVGNVHATFCWDQILRDDPNVDFVVRGEGERTMEELVQAVAAGEGYDRIRGLAWRKDGVPVSNEPRPFEPDLDVLTPAWDLVDWPLYYYRPRPEGRLAIANSARGCGQRCSFCSQQKFWARTWRGRDPLKFVTELEMLRDTYGVRVTMLSDETPTSSGVRWEKILDLMIERGTGMEILMETRVDDILRDEAILPKYVKGGVSHVYVGVESTSQSTLDLYQKDIKVNESKKAIELINAHGMVSETSFVLGTPEETAASIRKTVELAKWYAPDMAFFLALTPWPYADISPQLDSRVATRDYRRYNLVEPVMKPDNMTMEEMQSELHRATGHFFHDKFKNLDKLSPGKRSFMVKVLKLLIENSYLGHEMHRMASGAQMPESVKAMLAEIQSADISGGRPNDAARRKAS